MSALIIAFLLSVIFCFILIRYASYYESLTNSHYLDAVQTFHAHWVPRVGGLGLVLGITGAFGYRYFQNEQLGIFGFTLLFAVAPVFVMGLIEDLTGRVSVRIRFIAAVISAGLAVQLFGVWLNSLNIMELDHLMAKYPLFAIFITCFAVVGVINAFNIIDGYNGLAGMAGLMILGGMAYVAFQVGDIEVMVAAIAMIGALLGFLIFNYPFGLIFLGDGGAYIVGFWVAELSILLTMRHLEVSPWFPILLCSYPVFETLFTIYRRVFVHRSHPCKPDSSHLHQLIYKRIVHRKMKHAEGYDIIKSNSLTAPYLWLLTLSGVIPAVLFWGYPWLLKAFLISFVFLYVYLYRSIAKFRTPRWIVFLQR